MTPSSLLLLKGYTFRVGGVPFPMLFDKGFPVKSKDPLEVAKKYRLYEGKMLQTICQVNNTLTLDWYSTVQ